MQKFRGVSGFLQSGLECNSVIDIEEYGKLRTVPEFLAWVDGHADHDQENKKNNWVKKFNQEARPLRQFLAQYSLPAKTVIQLDTTEDSYDAILILHPGTKKQKKMQFQIVSTETEETLLMHEHLKKHGMAWLPAGAKGNYKKWEEGEGDEVPDGPVTSKNELVHENIDQIIDRINKKINKKYADKLYLLVSFNDFFLANMPGKIIKKFVVEKILPNDSFIKIFLASEHKLIEL